jgi:hypothetical protein
MFQTIARYILVLSVLAIAFGAGAVAAIIRGWGSPVVYVDVVNSSGKELRSVVLEYESCGSKNQLVGPSLPPSARSRFNFLACGEAGYQLRVRRADGTELVGSGGYAESGYRATETVEHDRIRSEVQTHRF